MKPTNTEIRDQLNRGKWTGDNMRLLLDRLEASEKDTAFYRCCALSGEIPKEGDEPSAIIGSKS